MTTENIPFMIGRHVPLETYYARLKPKGKLIRDGSRPRTDAHQENYMQKSQSLSYASALTSED